MVLIIWQEFVECQNSFLWAGEHMGRTSAIWWLAVIWALISIIVFFVYPSEFLQFLWREDLQFSPSIASLSPQALYCRIKDSSLNPPVSFYSPNLICIYFSFTIFLTTTGAFNFPIFPLKILSLYYLTSEYY